MSRPTFRAHRPAVVALLLVAAAVAASCSSGTKTTAQPTTTAGGTPSASTVSAVCRSASGTGAGGPDNVVVPGDIPDTQAYVTLSPPTGGYKLDVPEGWARSQAGAATTLTDKFNAIAVEIRPAVSAPTTASAQSADVPALSAAVACFTVGKVSEVSRKAGAAVLITYRADSAANPVTGKVVRQDVERYEFWHAGREAVITLSAPQGSDNVDPWRRVTDSFTWAP